MICRSYVETTVDPTVVTRPDELNHDTVHSTGVISAEDMENLDPKAVFANERTLLHYAEKGMQLGCYLFGAVCIFAILVVQPLAFIDTR